MKISDRDKKLILFVLLAAVIALPIFLFIRPTNTKTADLENQLVSLNERYDYLKALYDKKDDYEKEIVRLNAERDSMIEGFAGGVLFENTIMFLRDIELSEDHNVRSQIIAFADDEETPITEASVDENGEYVEPLTAIKSTITVDYCGHYSEVKEFINFIFTYKDKMNLSSMSMRLDPDTNLIVGTFVLDQYAVSGNGKTVEPAKIPGMLHGTDRLYRLELDEEGNVKDYWSSIGVTEFNNDEEDVDVDSDDSTDL